MIAELKRLGREVAANTGTYRLSRVLSARCARILVYHGFCGPDEVPDGRVRVDVLRTQLVHMKRYYHPLRLSDLARLIAVGAPLPRRTVAITVDDGYADFARWAFPVLKDLDLPVTLFVVSGFADNGGWLWADKLRFLRSRAAGLAELTPARYAATLAVLKRMHAADRETALGELAARAHVAIPARPPAQYAFLSWAELRELAHSGLVEIGAHSRSHALLAQVDSQQARDETLGVRRDIERQLDVPVTCFCYPNGMKGDYAERDIGLVRDAGYLCACASHLGYVTARSDRYVLARIGGSNDNNLFRKYVDGFEYLQRRLTGRVCS
ncbi:MAG: polysaccharide deacetylase family protein [Planctomycetes bacterium]|nr:polysaccharide deacetylase family protein [Planctomycetota bacterium]